jgi:uroporphyrinogen III methyltransferase/synthase
MRRIEDITLALIEGGRAAATPTAVIQWGARPEQRVVTGTLGDIAARVREANVANPAVIVVGDVVRLRDELRWYDDKPLFGKRMLVARPAAQAAKTAQAIRERGAEPIVAPAIEIVDPPEPAELRRALAELDGYDWVLFTSANGVERAFAELRALGRDARAFGRAALGAIGPATAAALRERGLEPELVAEEHVGEGLARAVLAHGGGRRILLPRALVARDALPAQLRSAGCDVDVVAAYATRAVPAERARATVELLERGGVDVVLFTASSTVGAVCNVLGAHAVELLGGTTVASIGPITTRTAIERGLRVDVTADVYTVSGLLDALERFYATAS